MIAGTYNLSIVHPQAQAIIRLANDPARRVAMGEAAAKRAGEKFSWDEKFDRMCGHYREAKMKPRMNAE